jgi:hypothetical protein
MSGEITPATRVRITAAGKSIVATLANSEAARDFASLLPLRLTMNDLFRREKFAPLPRAISEAGKRTNDYAVGTIGYWPPGPDVAIFYRQDGERIPNPGLIVLGMVKTGIEALDVPGELRRSRIEVADNTDDERIVFRQLQLAVDVGPVEDIPLHRRLHVEGPLEPHLLRVGEAHGAREHDRAGRDAQVQQALRVRGGSGQRTHL